jgi:hypothetical protein
MPYTGTTPYTAQEFVPGQKALAQDITNMSYVLARLDTNAANAYCVKQKTLSTDNQTIAAGTNALLTLKDVPADPLGMSTDNSTFTVPFDGIWTVSGYLSFSDTTTTKCGIWFRKNGVAGNGNLLAATTAPSANVSTSITIPLSAGDALTMYGQNSDSVSRTLWLAVASVVLVH